MIPSKHASEGDHGNDNFEKAALRQVGLPEDYIPESEEEAMRIIIAALED